MVSEDRAQDALQPPPAAGLSQLLRGSLVTQLIHVAATLGVADLLCDGPKSSHELAAALKLVSGGAVGYQSSTHRIVWMDAYVTGLCNLAQVTSDFMVDHHETKLHFSESNRSDHHD
jgi:hypothetical protein